MVVRGTCGYRVHGPGAVHTRDRRDGRERRHELGQRVRRGARPRGDDAEDRPNRIISSGYVIISIAGVEPDFVASADARHCYEGIPGAAPSGIADHRLRDGNSVTTRHRRAGGRSSWIGRGYDGCALMRGIRLIGVVVKNRVAANEQIPIWT